MRDRLQSVHYREAIRAIVVGHWIVPPFAAGEGANAPSAEELVGHESGGHSYSPICSCNSRIQAVAGIGCFDATGFFESPSNASAYADRSSTRRHHRIAPSICQPAVEVQPPLRMSERQSKPGRALPGIIRVPLHFAQRDRTLRRSPFARNGIMEISSSPDCPKPVGDLQRILRQPIAVMVAIGVYPRQGHFDILAPVFFMKPRSAVRFIVCTGQHDKERRRVHAPLIQANGISFNAAISPLRVS